MLLSLPSDSRSDGREDMSRIAALDALRGVAALAIILFHYEAMLLPNSGDQPVEILRFRYAMLGVELFFVISGFVILATISRSASAFTFLVRRAARIYPAYWLSVAVAAAALIWDGHDVLRVALVNLTMLQSFVHVKGLIPPYWTLAYELWFYILIAVAFHFKWIVLFPVFSAVWLVFAFAVRLLDYHSYGLLGILSMLPFGQFFIAGMMIYSEHHGGGTRLTRTVLLGCLLYCGFGREDWSHVSGSIYLVGAAVFFVTVYLAAHRKLNVLQMGWLVGIGQISYSLYLLHVPVALICIHIFQQTASPGWLGVAASIPVSILAAAASRKWVEKPGQRAINASVQAAA